MIYAHILVEAYFNWIVQHRMLTHHDVFRKRLGQIIYRIRSPVSERWLSVIEATGFFGTGVWSAASGETRSRAEKLSQWRNYIAHYKARPTSIEELPRTRKGVVISEAEQRITLENANEALEIAGHLIAELHRVENTRIPEWASHLRVS
jgi:hypothetical protein